MHARHAIAASVKLDRSYKCAQDPRPNLLARDRAAAAAAAAVLLVRALDGLAPLLALAALLVLPEVDAARVLGPGAGVVLVELPEPAVAAVSRAATAVGRANAIDATRGDETRSWVLYFFILGRRGKTRIQK